MTNHGLIIQSYSEGEINTRTQMCKHKDNFVRKDNDVSKIQQYHFLHSKKTTQVILHEGEIAVQIEISDLPSILHFSEFILAAMDEENVLYALSIYRNLYKIIRTTFLSNLGKSIVSMRDHSMRV